MKNDGLSYREGNGFDSRRDYTASNSMVNGGYYIRVKSVATIVETVIPGTPDIPATPGTPAVGAQSGWITRNFTDPQVFGWCGPDIGDPFTYDVNASAIVNRLKATDAADPTVTFSNYRLNLYGFTDNVYETGKAPGVGAQSYLDLQSSVLKSQGFTIASSRLMSNQLAPFPSTWSSAARGRASYIGTVTYTTRRWGIVSPAIPATPGTPFVAGTPSRTIRQTIWQESKF